MGILIMLLAKNSSRMNRMRWRYFLGKKGRSTVQKYMDVYSEIETGQNEQELNICSRECKDILHLNIYFIIRCTTEVIYWKTLVNIFS